MKKMGVSDLHSNSSISSSHLTQKKVNILGQMTEKREREVVQQI